MGVNNKVIFGFWERKKILLMFPFGNFEEIYKRKKI